MNEVLSLEGGKMTGTNPGLTVSVEVEDNALPYSVVTGRSPPTAAPIRCIIVSRSVQIQASNLLPNASY